MCFDVKSNHLYTYRHVLFNESKFPSTYSHITSLPHSVKPTPYIWLSNLLYLHSSNQPSILGSYGPSTSSSPIFVSPSSHTTHTLPLLHPSTLPLPVLYLILIHHLLQIPNQLLYPLILVHPHPVLFLLLYQNLSFQFLILTL